MGEENRKYTTQELEEIRCNCIAAIEKDGSKTDALIDLVCADCLLCEQYIMDMGPGWKNIPLCEEILQYIPAVAKGGKYETAIAVCTRAADTLYHHPRLKHRLLKYAMDIRASEGLAPDPELEEEVDFLARNIQRADAHDYRRLENRGHLKADPVEWTEGFEKVIHLAQEKADTELADHPRGMGFCHAYWPTLRRILREDYNIVWRSPAEMNRGVIFD